MKTLELLKAKLPSATCGAAVAEFCHQLLLGSYLGVAIIVALAIWVAAMRFIWITEQDTDDDLYKMHFK